MEICLLTRRNDNADVAGIIGCCSFCSRRQVIFSGVVFVLTPTSQSLLSVVVTRCCRVPPPVWWRQHCSLLTPDIV